MRIFIGIFLFAIFFSSCKQQSDEENTTAKPTSGKELSQLYCVSCHLYPEPDLLDKDTWENYMLPRMGYMYGIYTDSTERADLIESNPGGALVEASNLFPAKPQIKLEQWEAIKSFYLSEAPDQLPAVKSEPIMKDLSQFSLRIPAQKVAVPSTTLLQFSETGSIFLGDAHTQSFSVFDPQLQLQGTGNIKEGVVSLHETKSDYWLTVMGSFAPSDNPQGFIAVLSKSGQGGADIPITHLQRPVDARYGDVNGDGTMDLVVAEFGKWTGALSLYTSDNGTYTKTVLHPTPGAIATYLQDMNDDGHLDVVAMFAQGAEGIDIFYNDGLGEFTRERVLDFHPSMGGSSMQLIDYNQDGHLDILYTAGDNADYKPVMKPWHGVYVFVNDGSNAFSQELFLHLNGAYGAGIADFDMDGDMDVAAISFFPDWVNSPEESFVYFENQGTGRYTRSTFEGVNKGRWVVMDAADYDGDGDLDLALGSLAFEVVPKLGYVEKWMQDGIPFVILENTQH